MTTHTDWAFKEVTRLEGELTDMAKDHAALEKVARALLAALAQAAATNQIKDLKVWTAIQKAMAQAAAAGITR